MRGSAAWFGVALAGAALSLAACGGGDDEGKTSAIGPIQGSLLAEQHATSSRAGETVYRGTLRIAVGYYGYDCKLRDTMLHRQGARTYRMPVRVILNPPASVGSVREGNPFNLVVSADPGNEAGITLVSATVSADPRDGRRTLFAYWKITRRGSRLDGRLTQSWRQAGLALNLFPTDRLIVPCRPDLGVLPRSFQTIAEGATLTGSLTDHRVDLTVKGQTFDRERRFTARISATR
jgi:hypothetical protein